MKHIFFTGLLLCTGMMCFAQDNMHPTPAHKGFTLIKNVTVHTGTGTVLPNTSVLIKDDKIAQVGNINLPQDAAVNTIDGKNGQLYPGLIIANTNIGLREIGSGVKGSNDYREIGDLNPNVRSIVAYNADSKIINTLRSNGILLAGITPQGNLFTGTSSVVQFDAWNWEDAAYKMDNGIHIDMPSLFVRPNRNNERPRGEGNPLEEAMQQIEMLKTFFREAKAYNDVKLHDKTNLKFEAVRGLFDKTQTLFVHCNLVKEMLVAADFVDEFGFKVCIVGGSESYQIAPLLKQKNMSVILNQTHNLPTMDDDDIDQPFKTPAALQKAGVLFAINDQEETTTGRNLPFNAGTAVSYGLTKEEGLAAVTLNAAKILGVDDKTGSIEVGKDANLVLSTGDILDMGKSIVTEAFIQGRMLDMNDKHKELNKKYTEKYGIK